MPRKKRGSLERKIQPDPIYNDVLVSKVINRIMWDGKKTIAEKIVYGAMDIIKEKTKKDPLEVLKQAIENIKPEVEVKSRRVGGATYQVPVEVRPARRTSLAIRWLVTIMRSKSGRPAKEILANELIEAYNNTGAAIKKKEDTHRMAEANKAFASYRW
jgi:small subunit ribosomal protein S7